MKILSILVICFLIVGVIAISGCIEKKSLEEKISSNIREANNHPYGSFEGGEVFFKKGDVIPLEQFEVLINKPIDFTFGNGYGSFFELKYFGKNTSFEESQKFLIVKQNLKTGITACCKKEKCELRIGTTENMDCNWGSKEEY